MAITARNLRFIELYIQYVVLGQAPEGKRCSAAQAYIDTGYRVRSLKAAEAAASRLLSNVNVSEIVERRKAEILEKQKLTTDKVLQELRMVGFANMADYYHPDGRLKEINELTREQTAAIQEVNVDKKGQKYYKLFPKLGGLELIGRNLKMFTDKLEIDKAPVSFEGEGELQD